MSRILVLDDDSDILKYCDQVLRTSGHEVLTCSDAYTAVSLLEKHNVDLLVVDVVMPQVDGFAFLRTIKKIKANMPPVLMLTGRKSPQDIKTALELGATDYMVKPFDKDVFTAKVESILGKQPEAKQITFAEGTVQAKAELILESTVLGITEMGLKLRSPTAVVRNTRMKVNASIFKEIGIETPTLRAATCTPHENETGEGVYFEIFVSFIGLDEFSMQKIRRWISNRTIALKKAAAL